MAAPLPAGTLIAGKYRLVEQLGRGHAADVYRAVHVRRDRTVALKLLDPEEHEVGSTSFHHRYAIDVHEVGRDRAIRRYYVAMDFVEGRSLSQLMQAAPLSPERVMRLGLQLLDVLGRAHHEGLVHRALTPSKLLVTRPGAADEELRVLGFALGTALGSAARPPTSQFTRQAEALRARVVARDRRLATRTRLEPRPLPSVLRQTLALAYVSPEVLLGRSFDQRADLYSVGAILYAALAQVPPFQVPRGVTDPERALRLAIEGRDPKPVTRFARGVPPDLAQLVARALSKSPADRPQSARAFAKELRRSLSRAPVALLEPGEQAAPAPPPPLPDPPVDVSARAPGMKVVIHKDDLPPPAPRWLPGERPPLWPQAIGALGIVLLFVSMGMLVHHYLRTRLHDPATRFNPASALERPDWAQVSTVTYAENLPLALTWGESAPDLVSMRDGTLAQWIPAGTAQISSVLRVRVEGFFLARHEVTWGQLMRFCNQNGVEPPPVTCAGRTPPTWITGDHPATDVPFELALKYCEWAQARLPSEAEWAYASGAGPASPYPWGDDAPREEQHGWFDTKAPITWKVGSAPANRSAHGVWDTYGNAAEWLSDGRLATFKRRAPPDELPQHPRGFRLAFSKRVLTKDE